MKLILFSGFLGSGKTMSIISLAKEIMEKASGNGTRLVIVENEVGETGIDDKVLSSAGYEVKSLLSGCICCTLQTGFTKAIKDIEDKFSPDYVIFEPSGIAYPDRIINTIRLYGSFIEYIKLVTVIDSSRWKKLMKITPSLITAQIKEADIVLINKCDLVSNEDVNELEKEIVEINPKAVTYKVIASDGANPIIWRDVIL